MIVDPLERQSSNFRLYLLSAITTLTPGRNDWPVTVILRKVVVQSLKTVPAAAPGGVGLGVERSGRRRWIDPWTFANDNLGALMA